MSPVVFVVLPLALTLITLVALVRAAAQAAAEADRLRMALARVQDLRPMAMDVELGARRLGAGIARLRR